MEAELDGPEVACGDGEACGGEPPVGEACVVGEGHGEEAAKGVEEGYDGEACGAEDASGVAGTGGAGVELAEVCAGAPADEVPCGDEAADEVAGGEGEEGHGDWGRWAGAWLASRWEMAIGGGLLAIAMVGGSG